MSFRDFSIRLKLMVIVLSTSGIVLLLTSVAFLSYEWYTFRHGLEQNITTLAKVVAENSTAALAFRTPSDAREVLDALKAENAITSAVLFDQSGKVFAFYPDNLNNEFIPVTPGADGAEFNNRSLIINQPVIQGTERYGTLYVRASLSGIYASIWNFAKIVTLIFLVSFFAAFVLSTILQKGISVPLLSLASAARSVSDNRDFSVRVPKPGNDELGSLTETFNQMLSKIQEADAGLRRAIGEKDVLIQEVHHRVKNNLQVILSLFDMQARQVKNEEALIVFEDCKTRIRSMSLVHELLYGASDLSKIDFREYAHKLTRDLTSSYNHGPNPVQSDIDLNKVELDIGKAVPLGLLTNEILTNSLKHAFTSTNSPRIFIKQVPGSNLILLIGDNGSGLPSEVELASAKSFGMRIITLLSEQLHAKISVNNENGTVYRLEIPL
jgi:two-component sensor histidine kinase